MALAGHMKKEAPAEWATLEAASKKVEATTGLQEQRNSHWAPGVPRSTAKKGTTA